MQRREAESVGDIIKRAIESSGAAEAYDNQRICYLWPEVVGHLINRHTTRRWVESGTLHVVITSASLKNELAFHRQTLISHLNKAAGRDVINNIIFH
ncbi:MAG: DUF721 domain-containing protein [Muribaculaceae bacterium]|nr:DUF721 domain-containing protein [Muribaculaceae bacterium]